MITVRARWLAAASAGGAALGHLLDELGVLPGVHESAAVRLALLDPSRAPGIVLVVVGALVAGWLADRLLRHSAVVAAAALLVCQLVAAAGLESVARGRLEVGPVESGGLTAVAVQLAVALVVVAAAVLTALALQRIPRPTRATTALPDTLILRPVNGFAVSAHVSFQGRAPPAGRALLVP